MKNQIRIAIILLLVSLFVLTTVSTVYSSNLESPTVNSNLIISSKTSPFNITLVDSNGLTTQSFNFTFFGNTYTAVVVTNSILENISMSESGLGIQFQASVPPGTLGFCEVTVPSILVGSDIVVFENNILLEKNVDYTEEYNGEDYIFHLNFDTGTHTFVVEARTAQSSNSGIPIETIATIAVAGIAAAGVGAAIYGIKHVMVSKAASAAGGAGGSSGGGGGNNITPSGGGGGSVNVPTGTNVMANPHPKVQMKFSLVDKAGVASANPVSTYPTPPEAIPFLGLVFDVKTTAIFTGLVLVGLLFDGKDLTKEEKKKLRVYRNDPEKGGIWEDVTSHIDVKKNIAYGSTDHFSIFGVR